MENKHTRTFVASSELFSDFSVDISLYNVSTIDEIIQLFTTELETVLKKNNFTILCKKLEQCNFHIHSYTIEDILTSGNEDIFYVCDH